MSRPARAPNGAGSPARVGGTNRSAEANAVTPARRSRRRARGCRAGVRAHPCMVALLEQRRGAEGELDVVVLDAGIVRAGAEPEHVQVFGLERQAEQRFHDLLGTLHVRPTHAAFHVEAVEDVLADTPSEHERVGLAIERVAPGAESANEPRMPPSRQSVAAQPWRTRTGSTSCWNWSKLSTSCCPPPGGAGAAVGEMHRSSPVASARRATTIGARIRLRAMSVDTCHVPPLRAFCIRAAANRACVARGIRWFRGLPPSIQAAISLSRARPSAGMEPPALQDLRHRS